MWEQVVGDVINEARGWSDVRKGHKPRNVGSL